MVKEDRERSERENFLGHNFSLSWGWGLEGRISRGPPCYFLALWSFDTCRSTCSPRFRRRKCVFFLVFFDRERSERENFGFLSSECLRNTL